MREEIGSDRPGMSHRFFSETKRACQGNNRASNIHNDMLRAYRNERTMRTNSETWQLESSKGARSEQTDNIMYNGSHLWS